MSDQPFENLAPSTKIVREIGRVIVKIGYLALIYGVGRISLKVCSKVLKTMIAGEIVRQTSKNCQDDIRPRSFDS